MLSSSSHMSTLWMFGNWPEFTTCCQEHCDHVIAICSLPCQLPQKVNWEAGRKFPSEMDKGELKSFRELKSVFLLSKKIKTGISLCSVTKILVSIVVTQTRSTYILFNNCQNGIGKYRSLMINFIYEGWFP